MNLHKLCISPEGSRQDCCHIKSTPNYSKIPADWVLSLKNVSKHDKTVENSPEFGQTAPWKV